MVSTETVSSRLCSSVTAMLGRVGGSSQIARITS